MTTFYLIGVFVSSLMLGLFLGLEIRDRQDKKREEREEEDRRDANIMMQINGRPTTWNCDQKPDAEIKIENLNLN